MEEPRHEDRRRFGLVAASAGIVGVLLGAVAVMLGQPRPAVVEPAPVQLPAPLAPVAPTLADAVTKTASSVVTLRSRTRSGAGVIVDRAGWVVTNSHVIGPTVAEPGAEPGAPTVRARFADGREIGAIVVVADPDEDLAVLRLVGDTDEVFAAAELGVSSQLRVGDPVFAVGNPHGLSHSVASGIVAARDRTASAASGVPMLQLDASINPGNSGGPLFTLDGRLVGIVTARDGAAEGIAFALPIDHVHGFLRAITNADGRRSGAMGIQLALDEPLPPAVTALGYRTGLVVGSVVEGGAAAIAGIVGGDVIVELRGARLDANPAAVDMPGLARWLADAVRATFPGERLELALVRAGALQRLSIEVGAASEQEQAFIDAEVLLGVAIDRSKPSPTIAAASRSVGLGRYGGTMVGRQIRGLLGRDTPDVAALGLALAELRTVARAQPHDLVVWVRTGASAADEIVFPIALQ